MSPFPPYIRRPRYFTLTPVPLLPGALDVYPPPPPPLFWFRVGLQVRSMYGAQGAGATCHYTIVRPGGELISQGNASLWCRW